MIHFPLFGNYIEKLRKIEVKKIYIFFKAIFILLKSKIIFISIILF